MTTPEALFDRTFHAAPSHVVTAPGRVNLIGEHVDYNGLPVLPMAIQRRIHLHFRARDDGIVEVANTSRDFEPVEFRISDTIVPHSPGHWSNYVRAAAQALTRDFGTLRGFEAVVSSDLPVASGLSSSSALVVAAALALKHVNELHVDRMTLARILATGERYVGLRGGGMDQAVCLSGARGMACLIRFDPLSVTHVPVPGDWSFVVAFSLTPAEKAGLARTVYNQRTRECSEALERVFGALDHDSPNPSYPLLLDAHDSDELLSVADDTLDELHLARFRHVIREHDRVEAATRALRRSDLEAMGRLMDESHASLRDDFKVSTPDLDRLTELAREAGAAGACLTGAGLGGSVVAVCPQERAGDVLSALEKGFYRERDYPGTLNDHLFVVEAAEGAGVAEL